MKAKLLTEFIGTFFLCLVVALNANAGMTNLIAIGSVLVGLIYAGGYISAAHYNPAVTLAFFLRGRISRRDGIGYVVVQLLAALVAAPLARYVFGAGGENISAVSELGVTAALVGELLGTFLLVYVILHVATSERTQGNEYYGLAIGLTVVACGSILGKYSGGAFNPAVAVSQSLAGYFAWSDLWVYLLGCFGGGAVAVPVFLFAIKQNDD